MWEIYPFINCFLTCFLLIKVQVNDEIKKLSQLKKRIEEAIDGGSTEIPKWLEESDEFQSLLRDEVSSLID